MVTVAPASGLQTKRDTDGYGRRVRHSVVGVRRVPFAALLGQVRRDGRKWSQVRRPKNGAYKSPRQTCSGHTTPPAADQLDRPKAAVRLPSARHKSIHRHEDNGKCDHPRYTLR